MNNAENMFEDKYGLPLSLSECKKSNLLLTGCNQQGKSLTAMQICDVLMLNNWQILCMDSVGVWKEKSSIPTFFTVSEKTMRYVLPKRESIIFDISMLLPSYQREFIEAILNDVWQFRVKQKPKHWCMIVLEEAHQYMRNLRGLVSQSLMRICSVGANHGIRTLAISPSLTGIDTEFRRLSGQRFHFRILPEANAKRRFASIYSKDWYRVVKHLDVGFAIYYLNERMRVVKIPLFQSNIQPMPYREPVKPKPKGIIHRILTALNGSEDEEPEEDEEFDDIDSEEEIEIDESEEYPEEW